METTNRLRRPIGGILAAAATIVLVAILTPVAQGQGVTHEQLAANGWTCFVPPTVPDVVGCFPPGLGRPFPGNPDPRPSYNVLVFDRASGEFLHTAHLIRQDLYRGQPCRGGEPYRFLALIGYYECVRG